MRALRRFQKVTVAVLFISFVAPLQHSHTRAGEVQNFFSVLKRPYDAVVNRKKPPMSPDQSVERMAKEIDWLDHHIETYGTIVPKKPDVWGEARMTRHRQEVEEQLQKQLKEFKVTLNASIRRSDQSLLAAALSVDQAAAGATPTPQTSNVTSLLSMNTLTDANVKHPVEFQGSDGGKLGIGLEPTIVNDQLKRYLDHLNELRRINEGDDNADAPGYALNLVRIPISVLPGKRTREGYGAEITVTAEPHLTRELLPTTFRNLVIEDIVDQLGLPITKMLESDEAEKKIAILAYYECVDLRKIHTIDVKEAEQLATERQAEEERKKVLIEADRCFEDLLPKQLKKHCKELRDSLIKKPGNSLTVKDIVKSFDLDGKQKEQAFLNEIQSEDKRKELLQRTRPTAANIVRDIEVSQSRLLLQQNQVRIRRSRLPFPPSQLRDVYGKSEHAITHILVGAWLAFHKHPAHQKHVHLLDVQAFLRTELQASYDFLSLPETLRLWEVCTKELAAAVRGRKRWLHEKPPQVTDAIRKHRGKYFRKLEEVAPRANHTATASLAWGILVEAALLNDWLNDDVRRVATEKGCDCWAGHDQDFFRPTPQPFQRHSYLRAQERAQQILAEARSSFGDAKEVHWAEQTIKRITDDETYYGEHFAKLQQASESFNRYVRCRWPIQVFALDPVTQDQNVADVFSQRRELQLAAAVSLSQGTIGAGAAGRFVRRLEEDIQTIALNRTAVAFSHGSDTFGWRFYPRVQTPPTPGTAGAFAETLLGGPSRDKRMRQRQLEPGIRECVAIVIMPSFVPYVTFETRANWFGLTNPRKKLLTMNDTMKLSKAYASVQQGVQSMSDCGLYRPGDVAQMHRVVGHLDRRMPLQHMLVNIPYENTAGGFELFDNGVTDLGPELIGFYGAPGIKLTEKKSSSSSGGGGSQSATQTSQAQTQTQTQTVNITTAEPAAEEKSSSSSSGGGTTLFLVGNNFSVHETKVIAGAVEITDFKLLSRQIMQVRIPDSVQSLKDEKDREVVDVHVATPYGVTNHLLIPAVRPTDPAAEALTKRVDAIETQLSAMKFTVKEKQKLTFEFRYEDKGSMSKVGLIGSDKNKTFSFAYDARNQLPVGVSYEIFAAIQEDGKFISSAVPILPKELKAGVFTIHASQLENVINDRLHTPGGLKDKASVPLHVATNAHENNNKKELSFSAVLFIVPSVAKPATKKKQTPAAMPIRINGSVEIILKKALAKDPIAAGTAAVFRRMDEPLPVFAPRLSRGGPVRFATE